MPEDEKASQEEIAKAEEHCKDRIENGPPIGFASDGSFLGYPPGVYPNDKRPADVKIIESKALVEKHRT